MPVPLKVLVVEDSPDDTLLIIRELRRGGYDPQYQRVDRLEEMRDALLREPWDVVVADYAMPYFSGLSALELVHENSLDIPFIIVSGTIGEELAVSAMKAGVHDYVMKDNLTRLAPVVQREIQDAKIRYSRREAEAEIRRLKDFNENIVQSIFDGIVVQDQDGYFTFLNPTIVQMLGYSPEELIGKHWTEVIPADQHDVVTAADRRRGLGIADRYELELERKDGIRITVLVSGSPRFEDGRFIGTLAVFTDITEQRRIEDDLRKLKEFNESIVQHMQEGITVSNEDGHLTFVNPALAEMLGYTVSEIIGRGYKEFVAPEHWYLAEQADERRRQGISDRYELDLIRKDGSHLPVIISGRPVFEKDRFTGTLVVFTDITQRKRAEQALQRRAEELAALHAVSLDITASRDLPLLLHRIIEQAKSLLGAPAGSMSLCDPLQQQVFVHEEVFSPSQVYTGLVLNYGEGAAGMVAKTGKPLIIDDYRTWPYRAAVYEKDQPYSAVLSVPLKWKGQVTGVLQLMDDGAVRHFTEDDQELLSLFADQAAIALENARLFRAERGQLLLARTLQEVGALLTSELHQDAVLERLLDLLSRVVQYDSASVLLIDPNNQMYLAAGRGFRDIELTRRAVRQHSDTLVDTDWLDLKFLVIPDTRVEPRWVDLPGSEHIRSWVGAKLVVKGRLIGFLNIDSCTETAYDKEVGETVAAFANQAAIAIENTMLFEAEERRAAELLALRQASLSLTASLDFEEVLRTILESALQLIPSAFDAHIFLYEEKDSGVLTFGAALWADGRQGEAVTEPHPEGITYAVARSGQIIVVPDKQKHPLYTGATNGTLRDGAIISLPLKIGQRIVGVMNVTFLETHDFVEAELRVLSLLGDQAAIAIENARLFRQATMERRHLSLLYDIARELASSLDADEILDRAIGLTCQALGGTLGGAYSYEEDNSQLRMRVVIGREGYSASELDRRFNVSPGMGLIGWVVQNRVAVNVPDVEHDERWLFVPGLDEGIHSALIAPIQEGERLRGVLAVLSDRINAFTLDHQDLLQVICHQVGLALGNAERYRQVHNLVDLLAVEQRRLESLVERLPVGVLLLDEEFRVLIANRQGNEILERLNPGYPGGKIERLGPHAMDELCESIDLAQHEGEPKALEINLDDPPRRIFDAQIRPIGEETRQWVLTLRDVTQERENQERINIQDRLATVGQLAAGIAHDFNNIMAAILVYTDLLMADHELAPPSRERLSIIQQQVQRAASLIRQILDFSRRSVMEQSTLDLLPFIKELDKMLTRVLPETIQLELSYQPGIYQVNADPTRMQQVFLNLAVNARDAMPDGGQISFSLDHVQVDGGVTPPHPDLYPGKWIRITISDTGNGIPDEIMSHIFDPFFTTKPVGQGTGLGLAQVYGIVKQHEGIIDVDSQVGKGTKFIIYLPALTTEIEKVPVERPLEKLDGTGVKVLVAEDDQSTREALRAILYAQNFTVMVAQNGVEAVQFLELYGDMIALVIADMVMPEMGGVALYEVLQERWPEVKMLFVTGHPLEMGDQVMLEKGVVRWLQKPFSLQELREAIKALLGNSRGFAFAD